MKTVETENEGLKRAFMLTIPAQDIEARVEEEVKRIAPQVRMPGFRPGKVPMTVVKQRYGTAVAAEVLEESVNEATQQVMSERGLRAATQPKVDLVSSDAAQKGQGDLEFKVEMELFPDIKMPDFAAISLTRMKSEPQPETIDKALGEIAARQRELVEVEEVRPAVKGDILSVDFVGKVDGVAFPGGTGTDMDVEVAGSGFIPGFTDQIEGMSVGESRTINVTFPEEYGAKELAGKAATFDITAKKLKKAVLPELDDALATKLGFEGLDEVRQAISGQVQREYDQLSRLRVKRELLDALAKAAEFPVPQGMVDAEFAQIWARVEADRKEGKTDSEDSGKDEETLKAEYRAIAERRVRLGLLLAEIGRTNGIVVAPDEMTRAMRTEAGRYPGQETQVMEFFRKNPQAAESLRGPIFEEKVVDFVLELAKVTDVTVSPEELAREPEAPAAASESPAEAPAGG
jgi:trigger factor